MNNTSQTEKGKHLPSLIRRVDCASEPRLSSNFRRTTAIKESTSKSLLESVSRLAFFLPASLLKPTM